jgi:hypothetical protein
MTHSDRWAVQIRASRNLDSIIKEISIKEKLTKGQAADFVALQMKKIMSNKRFENEKKIDKKILKLF